MQITNMSIQVANNLEEFLRRDVVLLMQDVGFEVEGRPDGRIIVYGQKVGEDFLTLNDERQRGGQWPFVAMFSDDEGSFTGSMEFSTEQELILWLIDEEVL